MWLANRNCHSALPKWRASHPDFRRHFGRHPFHSDKPLLVVHNKYVDEWGEEPINHIPLDVLDRLLGRLTPTFSIVYFRHGIMETPREFSADHNVPLPYDDLEVLRAHPDVTIFDELLLRHDDFDYNTLKNIVYSHCFHFISSQGGGAAHCAMFSGSLVAILHRRGEEIKFAYSAGAYTYLANPRSTVLVCGRPQGLLDLIPVFEQAFAFNGPCLSGFHPLPLHLGCCHSPE